MPVIEDCPLLKLGYRLLVKVSCGNKTGTFVGGHTCFKGSCHRDFFVRCECKDCRDREDITTDGEGLRGRLYTLCMFERHGGKGACKKPLGSIKAVLGEGEESKALGAWLNAKSRELGEDIVGRRLEVFWPFEEGGTWFAGTVAGFDSGKGCHRINYDDGSTEHLKLFAELYRLLPAGPRSPQSAGCPSASQVQPEGEGQEESAPSAGGGMQREMPQQGAAPETCATGGGELEAAAVETPLQQHEHSGAGAFSRGSDQAGAAKEGGEPGKDGSQGDGRGLEAGKAVAEEGKQASEGPQGTGDAVEEQAQAVQAGEAPPAAPAALDLLRQYAQALAAARAAEASAQQAVRQLAAEVAELESQVALAQRAEGPAQQAAVDAEAAAQQAQQELSAAQAKFDAAAAVRRAQDAETEAAAARLAAARRGNAELAATLQRRRLERARSLDEAADLEGDADRLRAKRRRLDGEYASLQGRLEEVERLLMGGGLLQQLEQLQSLVELPVAAGVSGATAVPAEPSSDARDSEREDTAGLSIDG